MRILVTGVSGFSGSYVARVLADTGHAVTGLYRRETNFLKSVRAAGRVGVLQGGLNDVEHLSGPFDAVVHIAATSPAPDVTDSIIMRDNLEGTAALLEAATRWGVKRFIFFSSLSLYGDVGPGILDENTPIVKPDVYGLSKRQCEKLLAASNLPGLSLRLPGILGHGAHRNWLSSVAGKLKKDETVRAFHLDSPFNNAAHIDDIARLVVTILDRTWTGFDAIVLGARGAISVRQAIERLALGLGATARIETGPATKHSFILSSERAIMRWGYDPMEIGAIIDRYAVEAR